MDKTSFFEGLAELSLGPPRYVKDKEIEIDVEAVVGAGELDLGSKILRVRVRNFYLCLIAPNSSVAVGTRYAVNLQEFSLDRTENTVMSQSRKNQLTAAAALGAKIQSYFPVFSSKIETSGNMNLESKSDKSINQKQKTQIALISPLPDNRWLVGDPTYGDIRKPEGLLMGSYFQEQQWRAKIKQSLSVNCY